MKHIQIQLWAAVLWAGGAFTVAVNSLADGGLFGSVAASISLIHNQGGTMQHKLTWSLIHALCVVIVNAGVDVKHYMSKSPFPDIFVQVWPSKDQAAVPPVVVETSVVVETPPENPAA